MFADDNEVIEWNNVWFRALPGPMNLGIKTGAVRSIFCTRL